MVTINSARTAGTSPCLAITNPPMIGATAIGTRFRIDCTVNPIARRSFGRASPMTANSVGLPMLDQADTKKRPAMIQGQLRANP